MTKEVSADTAAVQSKWVVLPSTGEALLPVASVASALGVSVGTVWAWLANDPQFPRPIRRGEKFTRWRLSELRSFINGLEHGEAKPQPRHSRRVAETTS